MRPVDDSMTDFSPFLFPTSLKRKGEKGEEEGQYKSSPQKLSYLSYCHPQPPACPERRFGPTLLCPVADAHSVVRPVVTQGGRLS